MTAAIMAMLDSYRAGFARSDAAAAAEHYTLPCFVTSDADPVTLLSWATREECRAGIQRVLDWHRELGVASSRTLRQDVIELSPRIASLDLHVELQDADSRGLYDYRGFYALALQNGVWRISSIVHNQIPRLLAALKQRRSVP